MRRAELHKLFAVSRKVRSGGLHEAFDERLPFKLTAGQVEVSKEIEEDLAAPHPMYRLLQGEVGSGKTIIALRAMLAVLDSGGQAALLAPTEVLAAQHFRSFHNLLGDLARAGQIGGDTRGTQIALLTGSQSGAARRESLQKAQNGEAGIIIGTHALLSENVEFKDLGLIVVDEQHRFGVEQRDALRAKAMNPPHVLVMTATPIPRTVAMTVFGDLDVSTLRELPAGRSPITTHVIPELEKPGFIERAWQRIREEVSTGHQVYIVAPRISENDSTEDALNSLGLSAEALARVKRLSGDDEEELENEKTEKFPMVSVSELYPLLGQGALKGLRIAVLHGRLASDVKDKTMSEFSRGEIDVLISTTVIEVGVDVPNATMMVIMDADRFGVSQLHQLRGRVGRGSAPGLCLLVSKAIPESPAMERLNAVASTLDGFELSRIDLEQRREGDVLGASQSGVRSHLRLLRVLRDEELIEQAREVATQIINIDPDLSSNPRLQIEVAELQALETAAFIDKR
jgi:ATP-dependent DNA helicase RecG